MTNYVQAFEVWKATQPAGDWVLALASFPEDDPRCVTQGLVTRDDNIVTPDAATLDSAWATYESDPDTIIENTLQTTKQVILTVADKARPHSDKIGLVFAAVVTAQEMGESADATFTRITNALNDPVVGNGFRNLVMAAFIAQGGTAFDFANLGVVLLATKQQFNRFANTFGLTWTFMVTLTK